MKVSDNKKYYYLKLKDNFFDSDEIVILESMPDGYLYSNILLKLYLRSLKHEGKLMFKDRIPFNSAMLAQVTHHNVGTVEKAVKLFNELGLIEILDNGAIYMLDIQNFIGKSSTEADRIRDYRSKIAQEKEGVQMLQQMNNKSTPEKEKEIEIEIEIEKDILSGKQKNIPYKEIIDYLNKVTGKHFKNVPAHQKIIKSRFNEGFSLDDFKKVIDLKNKEWASDKKMSEYLRPATLFGNKMDNYLNSPEQPSFKNKNISSADEPDWSEIYGKDL